MTSKQLFSGLGEIYQQIRGRLAYSTPRRSRSEDLRRYRLRLLAIARQNRRLRSQLSDLGIKRITEAREATEAGNCFDAKTYREALDLNIKQEVYEKILKVVGGITLLGSFGLIFLLQSTVNDRVEQEFEKNPSIVEIIKERDRSRRDTMLALMQAAIQGDDNSWAEERIKINVKEIPEYTGLMESLLLENTALQEQELAIDYAGKTQDSVLRDNLLEALKKPIDAKIRLKIFQALMQYPPDVQIAALDVLKQEGENSQGEFWQEAIRILDTTKTASPIAGEVMSKALQKAESFQIAATFFILNPDSWKAEYSNLIPKECQYSPLNSLIELSKIDKLSVAQQRQIERILQALYNLTGEDKSSDDAIWGQDSISEEQLEPIHQYFALKLLKLGNSWFFRGRADFGYDYDYDYESVWKGEILSLFPSFSEINSRDILAANTKEKQHQIQNKLIDKLNTVSYVWNAQDKKYEKLNQANQKLAIDSIKSGYLDVFWFNQATDFSKDDWQRHIFPLFREAISQPDPPFSTPPTGTKEEQQKLQDWINNNGLLLQWNADSQTYQYLTDEKTVAQLKQGDLTYYLTFMGYGYYDIANNNIWQKEVLRFFPEAHQAAQTFFAASNPTGTNEEQDRLWRWVQAHQLQFKWDSDRKEYRLAN